MREDSWRLRPGDEIVPGRLAQELLGGGERFEAYVAWDERLHTNVVVKVLRPSQVGTEVGLTALAREVDILERLRHPVIVRTFGAQLGGARPHVVLEHLEGPRLSTLVRKHGRLPSEQLLPLGLQLASALHYLHTLELVHLDLKPLNVIMTGPPRMIDLSLAKSFRRAADQTRPSGTATWMAPEQCDPVGLGGIGPAADVWGLGATLRFAATGERPYDGAASGHYPQLEDDPKPVTGLPASVTALLDACTRREPDARPTPAEVVATIGGLLAHLPSRPVIGRLRPRWS